MGTGELLLDEPPARSTLDALRDGAMVVLTAAHVEDDGRVHLVEWDEQGRERMVAGFPAHVVDHTGAYHSLLPSAFISAETAVGHGWEIATHGAFVSFDPSATADEIDAALDAADRFGYWSDIEQGCHWCSVPMGIVLALVGGAALVTIVGVGVTVALAAAEGRADLATMAAVGAPPRRRRAIAAWQALVVGGLGTLLGLVLGAYYAYLIWPAIGAPDFAVPWSSVVLIGLAVPLLAMAIATIFTPSRLPMIRRVE